MSENLEALVAEAAAMESEAQQQKDAAAAPDEQQAAAHDLPAEVAALLKTAAAMLAPMFPSLAEIYTDATCQQLGTAAAPVMRKYGLSVGGIFDRWGAEITLAATALPVAVATYQGVKVDLAAKRKEEKIDAAVAHAVGAAVVKVQEQQAPADTEGMLVIPAPR